MFHKYIESNLHFIKIVFSIVVAFFFYYYSIHDILIDFMKYEAVGSFVGDCYMTHVVFSVIHDTCLSFVVNIDTYIDLSSYVRTAVRDSHVANVYTTIAIGIDHL